MFNFISKLCFGAAIGVFLYAWSAPEVWAICSVLAGFGLVTHAMIKE